MIKSKLPRVSWKTLSLAIVSLHQTQPLAEKFEKLWHAENYRTQEEKEDALTKESGHDSQSPKTVDTPFLMPI